MKTGRWIPWGLWMAVLALMGLITLQILRNRRLHAEAAALLDARKNLPETLPGSSSRSPAAGVPAGSGDSLPTPADGPGLMRCLEEAMADPQKFPVDRYGSRHPKMNQFNRKLDALNPEQRLALLREDPAFLFAGPFDDAAYPWPHGKALRMAILHGVSTRTAAAEPAVFLGLLQSAAQVRPELVTDPKRLDSMVRKPLELWAEKEPAAALAWLKQLHPGPQAAEELSCVILQSMARHDAAGAWQLMLGENLPLSSALPALAASMKTREEVDFSMTQLSAHPDGAAAPMSGEASGDALRQRWERENVLTVYSFACADFTGRLATSESSAAAMAFVEQWAVGPADRELSGLTAVRASLVSGSGAEATKAADWLMALVPEERRSSTAGQLMEAWMVNDLPEASEWLGQQPESPWRDAALTVLCRRLAAADDGTARQWAGLIGDPALRQEILDLIPRDAGN